MSRRGLWLLLAVVAAGTVARLIVAFKTYGVPFDQQSLELVRRALAVDPLGVYQHLPPQRWPYPTGFFAFVPLADKASRLTGLPYHGFDQVPAILADAAIALVVHWWLRLRGHGERAALAGAALVALGPSFAVISGYHGQIDSVAILPAVLGVLAWERGGPRRGLVAGALIGLGAAIKTTPGFCALALLPTARSWRERATVLAVTAVVPLIAVAPWVISHTESTVRALTFNRGVPGFGGWSAFIQPDITRYWSTKKGVVRPSHLLVSVTDVQNLIVLAAVLAVTVLLVRRRTPALSAASAIWLTVYAVNPNFAFHYLVWGLPFFLLAGHLKAVAAFQLAMLPATFVLYFAPDDVDPTGWIYFVLIQLAWLGIVAVAFVTLRRLVRQPAPAG